VARFALVLLLVASCSGPSSTPPAGATGSPTAGATALPIANAAVVWKTDAILDFPNSLIGDLELIDGNLITLTGEGTIITGTQIFAIDPNSGRTSWTNRALTDLIPAGDSSFHHAHYLRDGNDLIALVSDGSQGRSAVIRFSVPQRRLVWPQLVDVLRGDRGELAAGPFGHLPRPERQEAVDEQPQPERSHSFEHGNRDRSFQGDGHGRLRI
jgi:hypothetical protein